MTRDISREQGQCPQKKVDKDYPKRGSEKCDDNAPLLVLGRAKLYSPPVLVKGCNICGICNYCILLFSLRENRTDEDDTSCSSTKRKSLYLSNQQTL